MNELSDEGFEIWILSVFNMKTEKRVYEGYFSSLEKAKEIKSIFDKLKNVKSILYYRILDDEYDIEKARYIAKELRIKNGVV